MFRSLTMIRRGLNLSAFFFIFSAYIFNTEYLSENHPIFLKTETNELILPKTGEIRVDTDIGISCSNGFIDSDFDGKSIVVQNRSGKALEVCGNSVDVYSIWCKTEAKYNIQRTTKNCLVGNNQYEIIEIGFPTGGIVKTNLLHY